jgi:hypothetical protein
MALGLSEALLYWVLAKQLANGGEISRLSRYSRHFWRIR